MRGTSTSATEATSSSEARPVLIPKRTGFEVARTINYVHENPCRTKPQLVADAVNFAWSSAPVFAGLVTPSGLNVARAREIVGEDARWALPGRRRLTDLESAAAPTALLSELLRATARACGVLAEDLASASGTHELGRARAVFVVLGRLESYTDTQLGAAIGKTRQRVTQLAAAKPDLEAVRRARTLLRTPSLRRPSWGRPRRRSSCTARPSIPPRRR